MNAQERFESELRAWLRSEAPPSAPAGLVQAGMSGVRRSAQHRGLMSVFAFPVAAGAAVAGAVAAGVLAALLLLNLAPHTVPPGASPTPVGTSPTPAATPSPDASLRYADGIPRTLDGQPVLRGDAASAKADAATDDSPFLVGGWMTVPPAGVVSACAPVIGPDWVQTCGAPYLTDVAGSEDAAWPGWGRRLAFTGVDFSTARTGAAILRVHVHDPRAADCGPDRDLCEAAAVVESIVWNGDDATEPHPLTASAVETAIRSVQSTAHLVSSAADVADSCGLQLPTARRFAVANTSMTRPQVAWVELEPSAEALARALPVPVGADAALTDAAVFQRLAVRPGVTRYTCRWLGIGNLAVIVRTPGAALTAGDEAFIMSVAAALERSARAAAAHESGASGH